MGKSANEQSQKTADVGEKNKIRREIKTKMESGRDDDDDLMGVGYVRFAMKITVRVSSSEDGREG